MVHALRPQVLERAQLTEALADLARHWSQLTGVPVAGETTGEPRPLLAQIEAT